MQDLQSATYPRQRTIDDCLMAVRVSEVKQFRKQFGDGAFHPSEVRDEKLGVAAISFGETVLAPMPPSLATT